MMTTAAYNRRFAAERKKLERHYCDAFGLWRTCRFKPCRKHRACMGNAKACLKGGVAGVSRHEQWQARAEILASTLPSAGPPERMAREYLPGTFYG